MFLFFIPILTFSTLTNSQNVISRISNNFFYTNTRRILHKSYPPKKVDCIMKTFEELELANFFVPQQWFTQRSKVLAKLEKFASLASLKCDVTLTLNFLVNGLKKEEFYGKIRRGLTKLHPGETRLVFCVMRKLRSMNVTEKIGSFEFLGVDEAIMKAFGFIKVAKMKCLM